MDQIPKENSLDSMEGLISKTESVEEGRYLIDTTKQPKIGSEYKILEHNVSLGIIEWDKEKFKDAIFLAPDVKQYPDITGVQLLGDLKDYDVSLLNATVHDYLLEHPDEIPEDWKRDQSGISRSIYFFGTIFCVDEKEPMAKCLSFFNDVWRSNTKKLTESMYGTGFAAVIPK